MYAWYVLSPEIFSLSFKPNPQFHILDSLSDPRAQVAKIETERLLAQMVRAELDRLAAAGQYTGTFLPQARGWLVGRSDESTNRRHISQ